MTQEFESVLDQLADESRPVRSIDLFPLSDLGRERLPHFVGAWGGLTASRRLELVRVLVEQAEANVHLNFHAILRSLLTDLDAEVRRLAIEGLWEDEKPSLIAPLIRRLREDESVEVRASAATSLGRYVWLGVLEEIGPEPASAAESALYETWFRAGEVSAVRRRALEGLANGTMPDLNELILNAYYDEDELMRQSALFAMGRTADSRWSRVVLSELESHEPPMRFEAAQAAGEMGLRPAVRPLIRHLDDPDESVREAAVAALGKIGGPAAKRALQAVVKSDDEALAQAADDALAELTFGAEAGENPLTALSERAPGPARDADDLAFEDEAFEDQAFENEEDEFEDEDEASYWDDEFEGGEDDLGWDDEDEDRLAWDEDEDDDGDSAIDDLAEEDDDDF
jgi:HEAT repeat protein